MNFHIIAIEREYASGGAEIGEKTAQRLGIPCYGKEILEMAAREMRTERSVLEDLEEKAVGSFMYSMYVMTSLTNGGMSRESQLFLTESEIIRKLTQTPAIVVGRCAAHSLRDRQDVLRVFIHADSDYRKNRAVNTYGIPDEKAMEVLKKADRRRGSYYKANTGRDWKESGNYHLVLDSGQLGIGRCVDILEACYKKGTDRT